jgi:methionyl-tRNA formyltransferase
MPPEIVLLTGEAEISHLTEVLKEHRSDITVKSAFTLAELENVCQNPSESGRRLIAYCTSIIVPGSILDALDGPAYNFYPGPPTYPGVYPANFAIYDGAMEFGVTAHVMTEKVDEGAIIATHSFDVDPNANFNDLEIKAYLELFALFKRLGPQLVNLAEPLAELGIPWGSRKTTLKEYNNLRHFDPIQDALLSSEEKKRRQRAFG